MLFEYAILQHPAKKKDRGIGKEEIIVTPKTIVSTDDKSASMAAIIEHADLLKKIAKDRIEILIRPFI